MGITAHEPRRWVIINLGGKKCRSRVLLSPYSHIRTSKVQNCTLQRNYTNDITLTNFEAVRIQRVAGWEVAVCLIQRMAWQQGGRTAVGGGGIER